MGSWIYCQSLCKYLMLMKQECLSSTNMAKLSHSLLPDNITSVMNAGNDSTFTVFCGLINICTLLTSSACVISCSTF